MNDTQSYLLHTKATSKTKIVFSFALYFAAAIAGFTLSYLLFSGIHEGKYMIACDVSGGGFIRAVRYAINSQSQNVCLLLVLYFTAFSTLCPAVAALISAWRGACLGSVISLISSSAVGGVGGGWRVSIFVYFASSLFVILLSSLSSLYSGVMTYTYSVGDRTAFRSATAEYTKIFLIASGAVFIMGCACMIFITA